MACKCCSNYRQDYYVAELPVVKAAAAVPKYISKAFDIPDASVVRSASSAASSASKATKLRAQVSDALSSIPDASVVAFDTDATKAKLKAQESDASVSKVSKAKLKAPESDAPKKVPSCTLCGAPKTNRVTCPLNPAAKYPKPENHNVVLVNGIYVKK